MKGCLILANGYIPDKRDITYLKKNNFVFMICADGGANSAFKLKMTPDVIIGDLDSITPDVYKHFKNKGVVVNKISRQNDTDVEKCIKYAIQKKFTDIILMGATGDRLDHTFCNLGIVMKYYNRINIRILHEKSYLKVISGKNNISTKPGEIISLYGINEKTKFTSTGLKYPLINASLPFGRKESTSNIAKGEMINVNIKGDLAFIIRDFKVIKENGFIF